MEKEKLFKSFNYEPLKVNRFIVKLPKALDIFEYSIRGFSHDCYSLSVDNGGVLSVDAIEYVGTNIRDNYRDVKEVNEKIKGDNSIIIEYLDPTGMTVRREIYEGVVYMGERYCGCNYSEDIRPLTTSLVFRYTNRKDATAS